MDRVPGYAWLMVLAAVVVITVASAVPFASAPGFGMPSVARNQVQVVLLMRGLFILSDDTTPNAEGAITNGKLTAHYLKVGKHVPLLTLDAKTLKDAPWDDLQTQRIVAPDGTEYAVFDVSGLTLSVKGAPSAALAFNRSKSIEECPPTKWDDLFYVVSIPKVKAGANNLRRPGNRPRKAPSDSSSASTCPGDSLAIWSKRTIPRS